MAEDRNGQDDRQGGQGGPSGGVDLVGRARSVFQQVTGRPPESVTGLQRVDGGWQVTLDVVELERVPSSTDILAEYVVELDGSGELMGYRRTARFVRSQASSRDGG
jgi:hypothetical protein